MNTFVYDVEVVEAEKVDPNELSERVTTTCHFCEKIVNVPIKSYNAYKKLGHKEFHCAFCLRHSHHYKDNCNILLMSFKGLIGFYYHELYDVNPRKIYLSEIISCIEAHQRIGLQNPVFNYDYDNFMWFIDFNKIGNTKHKLCIEEVLATIQAMITAFNPMKYLNQFNVNFQALKDKFTKAIKLFHQQRQRPISKRILCPTLFDVISTTTNYDIEKTKIIYPYYFYETLLNITPLIQVKNMCLETTPKKEDLMSAKILTVTVNQKTTKGVKGWEGTISLPGLKSTKLSRSDGTTIFSTRGALNTVARAVGTRIGYEVQYQEPVAKVAAKAIKTSKVPVKQATVTSLTPTV